MGAAGGRGTDAFPFELPDEPVDQYRIDWWELDLNYEELILDYGALVHYHVIYHVNSPWDDFCGDTQVKGADFVNQWQLFRDGRFIGRTLNGWGNDILRVCDGRTSYTTLAAALGALRVELRRRIERCQAELRTFEDKLAELGKPT